MLRTLLLTTALGSSTAAWQRLPPRCSRLRQAVRLHMAAAPPLPEEGQEIEVECLRIAYGGQGIARTDAGATVMLTRAVPGEKLRAVVTRQRKRHVEARTTAVLAAGPASVTPPWSSLFATCGGCQLQHMAYDAQLVTKRQWVVDAIARSPGGAALRLATYHSSSASAAPGTRREWALPRLSLRVHLTLPQVRQRCLPMPPQPRRSRTQKRRRRRRRRRRSSQWWSRQWPRPSRRAIGTRPPSSLPPPRTTAAAGWWWAPRQRTTQAGSCPSAPRDAHCRRGTYPTTVLTVLTARSRGWGYSASWTDSAHHTCTLLTLLTMLTLLSLLTTGGGGGCRARLSRGMG